MTENEFLRELEAQMELPARTLNKDQTLAQLESWDSMAAVLFIALADEKLGITIGGNQIAKAKTVGELLALLNGRVTKQ